MSGSIVDLGTITGINLNGGSNNANLINNIIGSVTPGQTIVMYSNISGATGLINDGVINLDPTILIINGPLTGTGVISIGSQSTLELNGSVASTETIAFASDTAELILGDPAEFNGTISSLSLGDTIDISSMPFASQTLNINGNTLQITGSIASETAQLQFDTIPSISTIQLFSDGGTGTDLTIVPCFLKGTKILQKKGKTPVEDLRIGDLIVSEDGTEVAIKWIGHRTYQQPFTKEEKAAFPVLIKKNSIAKGSPCSDLYLSPEHSILIDRSLIPIKMLINGSTIKIISDFPAIIYYHIELSNHEVIYAENLAVESFIDCKNRENFENYGEYVGLYGAEESPKMDFAYPKLSYGKKVNQIKRQIANRIRNILEPELENTNVQFQGHLDEVNYRTIRGWVWYPNFPEASVDIQILLNGSVIAQISADHFRQDLLDAGIGRGYHGFTLNFVEHLKNEHYVVDIRLSRDHRPLGQSFIIFGAPKDQCEKSYKLDGEKYIPRPAYSTNHNKKALILNTFWPELHHSAESNALFDHAKIFQNLGFEIEIMASNTMSEQTEKYLTENNVTPIKSTKACNIEALLHSEGAKYSFVYLNNIDVAVRYMGLIKSISRNSIGQPSARFYNLADLHFLRLAREAQVKKNYPLFSSARRMLSDEIIAMHQANCVITHSPAEAAYLKTAFPNIPTKIIPWSFDIVKLNKPNNERSGVGFIGGIDHSPNRDALEWLIADIMPLVWKTAPEIILNIIGKGWTNSSFTKIDHRIKILGHTTDLSRTIQINRLTVAPLRFGSGIKGKVLDSMANGVPVIMTPHAAEGLLLTQTYQENVCSSAEEISQKIIALHADIKLNKKFSLEGNHIISNFYNRPSILESVRAMLVENQIEVAELA